MSASNRDEKIEAQLSVLLEFNTSDVTLDEIRERSPGEVGTGSTSPNEREKRVLGLAPALAWMLALIVLAGLGLGIGESVGGSGSHVASPKPQVPVQIKACSLLSNSEASQVLVEPVIVETPNDYICPYIGTRGMTEGTAPPGPPAPSVTIQTQRRALRPCRPSNDQCSMPTGSQLITVDGVRAIWSTREYDEGQGHEETMSTLAFTYQGHFVDIAFEFSHPDEPPWPSLSMVEKAMGYVVMNLKRLTS
jgi:hypothetical protein